MEITGAQFTETGDVTATVDGVGMLIPADMGNRHYAELERQGITPTPYVSPPAEPDPKLTGVEFEGVMCSATEADQNGLASVLVAIQFQGADFQPTRFFFSNGNTLVLSLENYQAFAATWLPFRQSFFQP